MNTQLRRWLGMGCLLLSAAAAHAQRTNVARDFPLYANSGKPDLTVDPVRLTNQMQIVDRYFAPTDCALDEGAVNAAGYRRLLRFDTVIMNRGGADVVIGQRSDPNNAYKDFFVFNTCHGHYHLRDFSIHQLVSKDGSVVVATTKQGFCFEDSFKYEDGGKSAGYDCEYQGLTRGWGDWYYKQLPGQWIDITGVPEGEYKVRVSINLVKMIDEGENKYPNVIEVPVRIPDPRKKVAVVE